MANLTPVLTASLVRTVTIEEFLTEAKENSKSLNVFVRRAITGTYVAMGSSVDILMELHEYSKDNVPSYLLEFILVDDKKVMHYIRDIETPDCFDVYEMDARNFNLESYVTDLAQQVLKPSDRLVVGPVNDQYWFAETVWESVKDTTPIELNYTLVKQIYRIADDAGIYDAFNDSNYHNAEHVVDINVPIIIIHNPINGLYDVVDGFHRLYKARWSKQPIMAKVLLEMPEPDFIDGMHTDEYINRLINRSDKTLVAQ